MYPFKVNEIAQMVETRVTSQRIKHRFIFFTKLLDIAWSRCLHFFKKGNFQTLKIPDWQWNFYLFLYYDRQISNFNEYSIQKKALSKEEGMSIDTCSVCCYIDNTYQIETTEEQISGQINNFLNFFFQRCGWG